MHFLTHYYGTSFAHDCEFGNGSVSYKGSKIATFEWLEAYEDIPRFTFLVKENANDRFTGPIVKHLAEMQEKRFVEAILDPLTGPLPECRKCKDLTRELSLTQAFLEESYERNRNRK